MHIVSVFFVCLQCFTVCLMLRNKSLISRTMSHHSETTLPKDVNGAGSDKDRHTGHGPTSIKKSRTRSKAGSSGSVCSSASSILMRQAAKAEAAKAKLEFAHKQAELERERARLEEEEQKAVAESVRKKCFLKSKMDVLDASKEKAIADAELKAMENYADSESSSSSSEIDTSDLTSSYIDDVNKLRISGVAFDDPMMSLNDTVPEEPLLKPKVKSDVNVTKAVNSGSDVHSDLQHLNSTLVNEVSDLDPKARVFTPQSAQFAELTN